MTDAVSDMLRAVELDVTKKEVEEVLPEVTAIVEYDLYPYYLVTKGLLQKDGGVRSETMGNFKSDSILKVFPGCSYEALEGVLRQITSSYHKQERQLRVDILKEHGVDFVTVR